MGQAQIASIKYFRSFRFSLTPEDRVKYQIKIGSKDQEEILMGEYELLNLSLSGFAFDSDQILGPDTRVKLSVKLGLNSYEFVGLLVRAGRHREKRGVFTYGIKNSKDQLINEKTFIEDLVSQFKSKRLRKELINLLVNEVPLENPKREDILGLMIGLFADLRPFDDRGEFLELFMLQSKKVMRCEFVSLYLFSDDDTKQIKLLYPFQMAGRRVFSTKDSLFEALKERPQTIVIKDTKLLASDSFYGTTPRQEGRQYQNVLLSPILNEDHEVVGIFECANLSTNVLKELSYYEQYAALIGFLCTDLCEKFSVVCPDGVFKDSEFQLKKKKNIMIGESTHARELRAFVQRKKADRQSYLLFGPAGSGKELLARIVHDESAQGQMPFGVVDIRDWDKQISLKELFCGDDQKVGKLELYSGGTLLLKNIDLLTIEQQHEMMEYCTEKYSICFVATTHRDLKYCRENLSRDFLDIFGGHDLSPLSKSLRMMNVRPLIERENDLTYLSKYFIQEQCQQAGLLPKALADHVLKQFYQYEWPLNMIELKLALNRALREFHHARIIDKVPTEVMPFYGECSLQKTQFQNVFEQSTFSITQESAEQLLIAYKQRLAEELMAKYSNAQKVREVLNLSVEEWMEWTTGATSKRSDPTAA